jgi:hypothetical protein
MSEPRIFVTTIEDSPGRVHIAMFTGHGEKQKVMRKELSLFEMQEMHEKLTRALWDRTRKLSGQEKAPAVNGG